MGQCEQVVGLDVKSHLGDACPVEPLVRHGVAERDVLEPQVRTVFQMEGGGTCSVVSGRLAGSPVEVAVRESLERLLHHVGRCLHVEEVTSFEVQDFVSIDSLEIGCEVKASPAELDAESIVEVRHVVAHDDAVFVLVQDTVAICIHETEVTDGSRFEMRI